MSSSTPPEGYVSGYRSKVPPHLHEEIFRRIFAGEKSKHICAEYGVSDRTIEHITREVAKDLGVPAKDWAEIKKRRRKEAWEHMKEIWAYRSQEAMMQRQEEEREAAIAQRRLEAADALERDADRRRRRKSERQRRLNEHNKRKQGWA